MGVTSLVVGLGLVGALLDDRRRQKEEEQKQRALDELFHGTDLLDDDDTDLPLPPGEGWGEGTSELASLPENDLSQESFQAGCDRVFWESAKALLSSRRVAVVDRPREESTIDRRPCTCKTDTMTSPAMRRARPDFRRETSWRRTRACACLGLLFILVGAGLLWAPWARSTGSSSPLPSLVSSEPVPAATQPKYATRQIRDFRGFEWVLAKNPQVTDEERSQFAEIDRRQWRWMRYRLVKADGSILEGGLGRPEEWFEAHGIESGRTFYLDLPEFGASGEAQVLSIDPCPDPGPKPHPDCRLVTGIFKHSSADCINVYVEEFRSSGDTIPNY